MTMTVINSSSLSAGVAGVPRLLLAGDDGVVVLAGFTFAASNGPVFEAAGIGNFIHVLGLVYGPGGAVLLNDTSSTLAGHRLIVGENGAIWGSGEGAVLSQSGNSYILNNGSISGDISAITIEESGAESHSQLINRGAVTGNQMGIRVYLFDGAEMLVENAASGVISGGSAALLVDCSNSCDVRIVNAGLITASGDAIITDSPARTISLVNSGSILGDVLLGGSRDSVDNRQGRIEGLVSLGGNNDSFEGGARAERVEGGAGRDALSGGGGADVIVYALASHGRDKISDWQAADQFEIDASGFGGGLVVGDLAAGRFHAGTTNRAQDGNDRFIFRTTDATLWFDKDGKGGAAAVLIADLQAGAKLGSADIFIV
jgi:Ca2+-binding RTX toxin-like protein